MSRAVPESSKGQRASSKIGARRKELIKRRRSNLWRRFRCDLVFHVTPKESSHRNKRRAVASLFCGFPDDTQSAHGEKIRKGFGETEKGVMRFDRLFVFAALLFFMASSPRVRNSFAAGLWAWQ